MHTLFCVSFAHSLPLSLPKNKLTRHITNLTGIFGGDEQAGEIAPQQRHDAQSEALGVLAHQSRVFVGQLGLDVGEKAQQGDGEINQT